MELEEVLKKRRSVRHYTAETVSRDLITKLIEAGSYSPVSCNLQLTQYVVVDDKNLLSKLAREVSYKFNYSPCSIVVLHDSNYSIERLSGVMTAGMAVENILLKATELGLGTCAMAGFKHDPKIKSILSIPDHMDILLIISVGYVDNSFNMLEIPRISLNSRFSFNNYSSLKTILDSKKSKDYIINEIINYRRRISPVYLDRLRLNTYDIGYYKDVLQYLKNFIVREKISSIIDLMSYDSVFIDLINKSNISNLKIVPSDYLENNLNFYKKNFGYNGILVSENNQIQSKEIFDMATFVFQLNFTPDPFTLLKSLHHLIKNEGFVLVSVVRDRWYRRVAKVLQKIVLIIKRKKINIYENNPFYKVGLFNFYSKKKVEEIFEETGFKKLDYVFINKGRGVIVEMFVFKKK